MTKQSIFLSIDFDADQPGAKAAGSREMDIIGIRDYVKRFPQLLTENNCQLIVREDQVAVTALLKYVLEEVYAMNAGDCLVIVPKTMSASDIADQYKPCAAVFMGGSHPTQKDFTDLFARRDVKLFPMPSTGGVSFDLYANYKDVLQHTPQQLARMKSAAIFEMIHMLKECLAAGQPAPGNGSKPLAAKNNRPRSGGPV